MSAEKERSPKHAIVTAIADEGNLWNTLDGNFFVPIFALMIARHTIRRFFRWAGLAALVSAIIFTAFAWIIFERRNELILDKLETYMHENQSGHLEVGALDLRVLRSFPELTLEADSISYYEQADSVRPADALPIFQAEKLFLALRLFPLIRGEVVISEIELENGQINILEDERGVLNIDRALQRPRKTKTEKKLPAQKRTAPVKPKSPSSPPAKKTAPAETAQLNLEEAVLSNMRISWQTYGQSTPQKLLVNSLTLSLARKDTTVSAILNADCVAEDLRLNRARLPSGPISLRADAHIHPGTGRLDLKKTTLSLDAFTVAVTGYYHHQKNRSLDLQLDASSNDLPFLSRLLKKDVLPSRDFFKSGGIFLRGRVFGELSAQIPQVDVEFGVTNLSFRLPGKLGAFKELGFEGRLSTGAAPDLSRAVLDIRNIRGEIPGGFIRGDIMLSNLVRPYLRCTLQSRLNLDGYDKVFNIDRVTDLKGQATLKAFADGPLRLFGLKASDRKPTFDITFNLSGLSFRLPERQEVFEDIGMIGRFNSGPVNDFAKSILELHSIQGKIPGGGLQGDISITNLLNPILHYRLAADMKLDGYEQLLKTESIKDLRGRVSINGKFDGPLALIGTHAMDSSRSSAVKFDSVSFLLATNRKQISALSGQFVNQNNKATILLNGRYASSSFRLNATIENLMHRIFKDERNIDARGTLEVDQVLSHDLVFDSLRKPLIDDRISDLSLGFRLTAESDTALDRSRLRYAINNLSMKLDQLPDVRKFSASGLLVRQQNRHQLSIDALYLRLPQGNLELSGTANFGANRQMTTKATIKLNSIPWAYVSEVSDELNESAEPSRKNMPVSEMDLLSTELNLSADLRTYPFDFSRLEVTDSRFNFTLSNGKVFSADRLHASFEPLAFLHPANSGAITGVKSVRGNLSMEKLKVPGLIDLNLSMSVDGKDDSLNAELINFSPDALQTGRLALNLASDEPVWKFRYEVRHAPIEKLVSRFHQGKFLEGPVDYTMDFSTRGKDWSSARNNLQGFFEVKSDSLWVYGIDIDDILRKFQKSQKINLTDVGAVVLAGPIGIVATKGTDFAMLASVELHPDQRTVVTKLLTRWAIRNQTMTTEDVAFATTQNRIAFSGSVNFAQDSIPGIRVAVVDRNGCSLMDQRVYGKFGNLKTGKLNVAKTLLGSVINFVDAIVGKDCEPIYTGEVKHPSAPK